MRKGFNRYLSAILIVILLCLVDSPALAEQPVSMDEESSAWSPAPVEAAPAVQRRRYGQDAELPVEVHGDEERRLHHNARRFARLLISEIKLYNEQKVAEGRSKHDLYDRLREYIDRSREIYDKRVKAEVAARYDYFHGELVNTLAEGDVSKLGSNYPGAALPVRPQPAMKANAFKRDPSSKALKWANDQLRKMSLEEKIGQLISVGVNATFLNQDSDAYRALKHHIEDNKVGGIILFRGSVYESVILVNRMQELAKYPLLVSADLEAGAGMRFEDTVNFPWNMAVGATGDPEYARRQGEVTAREARALGVQQIFAPVVDVNNNAANPVINVRSYGEDAAEVARFAAAFTEGAQNAGAIATAKHFPGHGDTAVDSHRGLPEINVGRDRLNKVEFVPFEASVNAGVGAVMVGHIALPQIDATAVKPLPQNVKSKPIDTDDAGEIIEEKAAMPATMSPVIGNILRKDLKFPGMIVTDALSMSGLTIYFTQEEAAVRALEAGADMLLKPADVDASFRGVHDAVKSGRITEQRVEDSARKILAAKYDLGLVDQRITSVDTIDRVVGSRDVPALATEIAEHAVTLVRDEDKLVPLKNLKPESRVFNLAVTNGDDRNWIANGFVSRLGRSGLKVETVVLDERSTDMDVQKAIERAKSADLVIASLYGRVRSGQALSVGIPEAGSRALSALIAAKSPIVGISFGNPYLLQSFPGLRTYLVAYGDMPSLQQAVARALLGEIDITGKLPISLPGLYPRGTGIQVKKTK